jgi:hypothetical protein
VAFANQAAWVDKNWFVADLSWGFAVEVFRHVEITYTDVIRTKEFRGQVSDEVFGSITIKGKFCF